MVAPHSRRPTQVGSWCLVLVLVQHQQIFALQTPQHPTDTSQDSQEQAHILPFTAERRKDSRPSDIGGISHEGYVTVLHDDVENADKRSSEINGEVSDLVNNRTENGDDSESVNARATEEVPGEVANSSPNLSRITGPRSLYGITDELTGVEDIVDMFGDAGEGRRGQYTGEKTAARPVWSLPMLWKQPGIVQVPAVFQLVVALTILAVGARQGIATLSELGKADARSWSPSLALPPSSSSSSSSDNTQEDLDSLAASVWDALKPSHFL